MNRFQKKSIEDNYKCRLPYSEQIFEKINFLLENSSKNVLHIGAGTGEIARRLTRYVNSIFAVDISKNMLEKAKKLPEGNNPKIKWINSKVETIYFIKNYSLITAGDRIHWMKWEIIFPLFEKIVKQPEILVLITRYETMLWDKKELKKERITKNNKKIFPCDKL